MFLHLGQNEIVPSRRVIGIFDLDKCSYSKRTREYLSAADKEGVVLDISGDIPKSFVLTADAVYLASLAPASLRGHLEE